VKIEPIYQRARSAKVIPGRAAAAPWQIMQRIDHPDPEQANAQALHDLENGATGLRSYRSANGARGFGLPPTKEALTRVSMTSISMRASASSWRSVSNPMTWAALRRIIGRRRFYRTP